jgi:hypothetical protein
MLRQTEIDFTHVFENNAESQINLDDRRIHFNAKCKLVFEWLQAGRELTVLQAAVDGVASLPRRIADLKEKGVLVSDRWNNGIKVWFLDPEQLEFNKKFYQ